MKEELLKIAQESLSSDEVKQIVKEKFHKALEDAIEGAFRWGDAKHALENKVKEVMVPYIENYDFSAYLPKLDSVLTELVNSDACMGNKQILENFKDLMTEPEQKEIKVTDLFRAWIKQCNKDIDTDDLEICYDDGVSYSCVDCEMRQRKRRAVYIFNLKRCAHFIIAQAESVSGIAFEIRKGADGDSH